MTHLPLTARRTEDQSAIAAFLAREDARETARVAHYAAQGFTAARCPRCGHRIADLRWVGGECREFEDNGGDEMCGGQFRPVRDN